MLIHFSHPNLNKCIPIHGILLGLWQVIFCSIYFPRNQRVFLEPPRDLDDLLFSALLWEEFVREVMQLGYSDQTIGWEFPHFRWWGKYPGIVSQKCPGRFRFRKFSNCPDMIYIYIRTYTHRLHIYACACFLWRNYIDFKRHHESNVVNVRGADSEDTPIFLVW